METIFSIWSVLTAPQRRGAAALLGLMLCSMLFEMLGIGMVVPALAFMVQDKAVTDSQLLEPWIAWLGHPTTNQLILGGLLLLLVIYVLKSCFLVFVAYTQSRFVSQLQASMSRRLFETYLGQPWAFHLQRNSAELIRNIDNIQQFGITCTSLLTLIAELLIMLGILGLLVWCETVGAIVVGTVLCVSTFFYDSITRHRLAHWGRRRYAHAERYVKHMQEGLGGAKDVKILGCEQHFIDRFTTDATGLAQMTGRQSLFQQIPRLWYELLAVTALCLLTGVMIWQGKPLQSFVPTLGLFATAAFRLLPSANRLSMAMQQIRFAKAQTETLKQELALAVRKPGAATNSKMAFRNAIDINHVCYRYDASHADSLKDVTIRIAHGSSVGLIGGSGAGKSTLVDIILGLLPTTSGKVLVDGIDIQDNIRGWQGLVGYVPQSIYLSDDTLRRNVAFGIANENIDEALVARAIRTAQLDVFVASLPQGLETLVGERGVRLSGGQRQRIGIARALYRDPDVLVLDEATSALDNETEKEVMAAVNSLHGMKTLVIVAHRLSTVAECDILYRLDNGVVTQGGAFAEVIVP
jgi:ABC-type bacteriocin/lantibiotic exporter with double-glycine peptidase domain